MSQRTNPEETNHTASIDMPDSDRQLLSGAATEFLKQLHRRFETKRQQLLDVRSINQTLRNQGQTLRFLENSREIREANWQVASIPLELRDRRVEITGPVDRKMVINGLNSGARVFMADFEDATAPTWNNIINGQRNLFDAVSGDIEFRNDVGKQYVLKEKTAVLFVRPRGWHLEEDHCRIDDCPISASLFDFGLFAFHNAARLVAKGSGCYFYLPKIESHVEADLWNQVIKFAEDYLGLQKSTIRVTVLIETLPAAFEMEEILHALREHIVALNCGRWDYIFSYIKCFQNDPTHVLPDRAQIGMDSGFLNAYSQLLIDTCHRRGALALGGMAAQIPAKNDAEANQQAFDRVEQDKVREATNGHDGTWVAHPGLIDLAMTVFDKFMPQDNQLDKRPESNDISAEDLLLPVQGSISEQGFSNNVRVALEYIAAWLGGQGCVPLNNLMEDAATAEIARAQIWQWVRYPAGHLEDGRNIDLAMFRETLASELKAAEGEPRLNPAAEGNRRQAAKILSELVESDHFIEFLTLSAYQFITTSHLNRSTA